MTDNALLLHELRHATIHPEQHDQGTWAKYLGDRPSACGTVGCLAGNTVIHQGRELAWEVSHVVFRDTGREYLETEYGYQVHAGNVDDLSRVTKVWTADEVLPEDPGYPREQIEDVAAELLGLDSFQAGQMFNGSNTIEDLWTYAIVFSGGYISIQDYKAAQIDAAFERASLVAG